MPPSDLKQHIWQVLSQVPAGKVVSYGQLAKLANCPNHSRYIGTVLKQLPKDTQLPRHRVINSKGRIAFPQNCEAYKAQKCRLEAEGVSVEDGKICMKEFQWRP